MPECWPRRFGFRHQRASPRGADGEAPAKAKAPEPAKPPQQAELAKSPFAPAVEAEKLQIKTCLPMVGELSRLTIRGPHTSVTGLSREAPNERMFSALTLSAPAGAGAAPSVSVMSATPTAKGHCDGASLRIEPSKQSCEEIAAALQKQNAPKPETLNGTLVYQPNATGQRLILLPAAASGCVVISSGAF